jgi:hypothetical protein
LISVSNLEEIKNLRADSEEVIGDKLNDDELILLIQHLPVLRRLDLSGCDDLTDRSMKFFADAISLEELDLSLCSQISDLSLKNISKLPRLKLINLNWCYSITDNGLQSLGSCITLERISLWSCEEVTDKGIFLGCPSYEF